MRKLSLILCSRNDNYCGDSLARLEAVLNHAGRKLHQHEAEVIVSDWGSDVPLEEVVTLGDHARAITRYNYIPRSVTQRFTTSFSEVHALNSAARLATGNFVGRIDQDTLIGDRFVDWFYHWEVSESFFYWSGRRELRENQPIETYESSTVYEGCQELLDRGEFWSAAVGIFLIPRLVYWDLGGYDEKNIYKNAMEVEFFWRLKCVLEVVDLGKLMNYDFYHLWHDRGDNDERQKNVLPEPGSVHDLSLKPNGDGWGLKGIL